MNKVVGVIAIIFLLVILVKGLAIAWVGVKAMHLAIILVGFVAVGFLWGKFTK